MRDVKLGAAAPPEISTETAARLAARLFAVDVSTEEIRPGIFEHTITSRPRRASAEDLIDEVVARLKAGGAEEV